MVKKINTTTIAERTFFEGGSGGGGEGGSGSGAGSGNGDKGKGKEDPHASRAKSVEDSSTKGEKSQQGPQPTQGDEEGGSGRDKSLHKVMRKVVQGEIRGKEIRFFIHMTKISITRESRMTLMHSTSLKKSKKK